MRSTLAIIGLVFGFAIIGMPQDINSIDTSQTQVVTKVVIDYVVVNFNAASNSVTPFVSASYRMLSPDGKTISKNTLNLTYAQTCDAATATGGGISVPSMIDNIMAIARNVVQQSAALMAPAAINRNLRKIR